MNVAERVARGAARVQIVARCLGAFRLEDGLGDQLQVRTRKARALLAVLAVHGRAMPREALADLLWSDRGPVQARASLRQAIFELQHLEPGGRPLLAVGREDVALAREALVTDLELIRAASAAGDWPRLLTLLESSDPGLLTDLDGLDPELDDWLRLQRAHEPGKAFAAAVDAAERCAGEAGPRAALDLVSEILRLDPVNEKAARLALRIDHQLGDSRSLHHHFEQLRGRLCDDYDAEPAAETVELYRRLASSSAAPRAMPDERAATGANATGADRHPVSGWRRALAPMLVLVAALGLFMLLLLRDRAQSPAANAPLLVAVLPFEQQAGAEAYLAQGLWDDTRAALSRNPTFRVLGRATVTAMARRNLSPDEYRRRFGVDYVLEGAVRRSGDQLLTNVSLTRTSDGVAIWEDSFRGRLGDPMALQETIASRIEGKLRGRLARGGGTLAEHIATTPEVYGLYSEARSLLLQRSSDSARRAQSLLRKALLLDPNYAPAWAAFAETFHFIDFGAGDMTERRAQGLAAARRALALAPRLAQAHAIYAFFLGDGSPRAEQELRLAVTLDPSDVQAWNWLGNNLVRRFRDREAAAAYAQAVAIDPIWPPAVSNLIDIYGRLGDREAFERTFARARRAGADEDLLLAMRIRDAASRGDLSAAVAPVRRLKQQNRLERWASYEAGLTLVQLGYVDEAAKLVGYPESYGALLRSERLPPSTDRGVPVRARDFLTSEEFGAAGARAMINLGHERDLVKLYREAFTSADEAIQVIGDRAALTLFAPTLAVALRASGDGEEAGHLLRAATSRDLLAGVRRNSRDALWALARIRAAQDRNGEAVALLAKAIDLGWLPDGAVVPLDIAQEPAFRHLGGEARFETIRKRILGHIAKERAELGPLKV